MDYPELKKLIREYKITKNQIALCIDRTPRTVYNKMSGKTPFTLEEVRLICKAFFPEMSFRAIMHFREE